jgi:hypothetical protein
MKNNLIITGITGDDDTFTGECGGKYPTFNVSKAQRDCKAGKHGKPFLFPVAPAYEANRNVEVDEAKVQRYMNMPDVLVTPVIMVIENHRAWMIDGHHRLRALYRLGAADMLGYAIEEHHRRDYLVLFNGQEETPFAAKFLPPIAKEGAP